MAFQHVEGITYYMKAGTSGDRRVATCRHDRLIKFALYVLVPIQLVEFSFLCWMILLLLP
jgi:hypothetical protein